MSDFVVHCHNAKVNGMKKSLPPPCFHFFTEAEETVCHIPQVDGACFHPFLQPGKKSVFLSVATADIR